MIIDFCVHPGHIWQIPENLQQRVKSFYTLEYGKRLELTEAELIRGMDDAGVDIGVVRAQSSEGIGYAAPNAKVAAFIKKYPDRLVALASINPKEGKKAVEEFDRCVQAGFKGLVLYPQYYRIYPEDEVMYPIYEKAIELDVPVTFIAYWTTPNSLLKYGHPSHFDDVAVKYRKLKLVVDALGGGAFDEMYVVACKNPNVYMTTSACPFIYPNGGFEHHMKTIMDSWISMDRILFASEYPLSSSVETKGILDKVGMSLDDKRKVYGDNAAKLLKL
jgi:predicted TIM-barrel fold metal-dependent hydrolase